MIGSLDWYFEWFERVMGATVTLGFFVVADEAMGQPIIRWVAGVGIVIVAAFVVPFLSWPVLAICAHVSRRRRRRRPSLLPTTMKHAERPHVVVVAPTVRPAHK
jgi:hypothetical protein